MRTKKSLAVRMLAGVATSVWLLIPLAAKHFSDWAAPENVGASVNSVFNEQHPALSSDGLSLYFVSDRPGGLGGFDLYVAHRVDREASWEDPVAVAPLNPYRTKRLRNSTRPRSASSGASPSRSAEPRRELGINPRARPAFGQATP